MGKGVQFGVTPVSWTQKTGLYSLTADTDTWLCMYMYRPDENRWTHADEQHMHRIQTVFLYRHTQRIQITDQSTCMLHMAPPHWDVNKCSYTAHSSHTSPFQMQFQCVFSAVKAIQLKSHGGFVCPSSVRCRSVIKEESLLWLGCLF